MAIAFDTAGAKASIFSGTPGVTASIDLTIGSNPNRILCLFIKVNADGSVDPSNVTWNTSETLTLGNTWTIGSDEFHFYYLLNPTSTTDNVSYELQASRNAQAVALVYSGVKQTGVPEDSDTASGTGTTFTLTSDPTTANAWLIGAVWVSENATYTATTGTKRADDVEDLFLSDSVAGFDNGPVAAGTRVIEGTISSSWAWQGIVISLAPEPDASTILARPMYFN